MKEIIIWDKEDSISSKDKLLFLWRSYDDSIVNNIISIPKLVEKNSSSLRRSYLEWIYNLGELKINNKTIIDSFSTRSGFSFWWMSHFVEKSNFSKSPKINDIIKLFAFIDWTSGENIKKITFESDRDDISLCLKSFCKNKNIIFKYKRDDKLKYTSKINLRYFYNKLPYIFQAIIWLLYYIVTRWSFRNIGKEKLNKSKGKITFISYFFNLVKSDIDKGKYTSSYWGNLPEVLNKNHQNTNWIHLYAKSKEVSTTRKAAKILKSINKKNTLQSHVMLESFLSPLIIFKILRDWVKVLKISNSLKNNFVKKEVYGMVLWPLIKEDWYQSFVGKALMNNCWNLNLFVEVFKFLPKQEKGFYLQENMDWEYAYLWAWKKAGNKLNIGVPHSSVRFWDLRYFFDKRSYIKNKKSSFPFPDKIAVNGMAIYNNLIEGGCPENFLIKTESLRYNHIKKFLKQKQKIKQNHRKKKKILVLGDSQADDTNQLLYTLKKAIKSSKINMEILVKPHPLFSIDKNKFPEFRIITDDLMKLFQKVDFVYCGSQTSAVIEACLCGLNVIQLINKNTLNLSPLRNSPSVNFVSSYKELVAHILKSENNNSYKLHENFFFLDNNLPKWKNILLNK